MTRLLVIPNEFPLPSNSGGRIDVWRRMQLLRECGYELGLMTWFDEPRDGEPSPALLDMLGSVCTTRFLTPIRRTPLELMQRVLHLGRMPSHVASRWVTLDRTAALAWARAFRPSAIVLDGLYGTAVARWLAQTLGVPWIYRSHNIEHQYMRYQWERARSAKQRLGLAATLWGLKRVETETVRAAALVLDISQSDAEHWRHRVGREVRWLPTVVDEAFASSMAEAAMNVPTWDVLYFGNLNSPNNVEAVRWLVNDVLPLLGPRPLRVALAGSHPNPEVTQLAASDARITLLANPAAMAAVAGSARVLVNPVLAGSGVNLKSVEMLFSTAALVSTSTGVKGMPDTVVACFDVDDDAKGFASAIRKALDGNGPQPQALAQRSAARAHFLPAAVGSQLKDAVGTVCDGAQP